MVANAVAIEPVSGPKFPANREINREFCRIRPHEAIFAPAQAANSMPCREIPYANGTGNFWSHNELRVSASRSRCRNSVGLNAVGSVGPAGFYGIFS